MRSASDTQDRRTLQRVPNVSLEDSILLHGKWHYNPGLSGKIWTSGCGKMHCARAELVITMLVSVQFYVE